jgi:large subunit ribosomal protein L5
MAAPAAEAPTARLKTRYLEEIRPALIERFEYTSVMQAPHLEKITLNMGVGLAKTDSKVLKAATEQLATIAGQQPSVRRARKSIAAFKLREGNPVGVAVTLRGERAYEFLDRLVSIAIPRIRDFRGLNPRAFDGRGNYSMGVREQIIFPEIDYDAIDQVRGLDVTITTSARSDVEAYALLAALGMPFSAQGRPKGYDPAADAAAEAEYQAAQEEREAAAARAEAEAAATATAEPEPAAQADEPGPAAEPELKPAAEAEPEPAPAAEREAPAEPAVRAELESESEPEPAAEAEPAAQAEPEPAAQAEAEPAAEEEPPAEAEAEPAPEEVPAAEAEATEESSEKESSD